MAVKLHSHIWRIKALSLKALLRKGSNNICYSQLMPLESSWFASQERPLRKLGLGEGEEETNCSRASCREKKINKYHN